MSKNEDTAKVTTAYFQLVESHLQRDVEIPGHCVGGGTQTVSWLGFCARRKQHDAHREYAALIGNTGRK